MVFLKIANLGQGVIALAVRATFQPELLTLAADNIRRLELDLCLVGVSCWDRIMMKLLDILRVDALLLFGQRLGCFLYRLSHPR